MMHAISREEAELYHQEYTDLFPKEAVTQWYLPAGILSLAVLVLLYGYASECLFGTDAPDYLGICHVSIGLLDFSSDYQLVYRLFMEGSSKLFLVFDVGQTLLALLVLSYMCNLCFLIRWYRKKLRENGPVSIWVKQNRIWVVFLMLAAGSNATILKIAWSRMSSLYKASFFNMPITCEDRLSLMRGQFISLLLEDIPLLAVQISLLSDDLSANTQLAVSIALITSMLSIVGSCINSVCAPAKSSFLVQQWVLIEKPTTELISRVHRIRKKFAKQLRNTHTDVILLKLDKTRYRIMFQYSRTDDTTREKVEKKIRATLEDYIGTDGNVVFEETPLSNKLLCGLMDVAHDFGADNGAIEIQGRRVVFTLEDADEAALLEFKQRLPTENLGCSLQQLRKIKKGGDKKLPLGMLDRVCLEKQSSSRQDNDGSVTIELSESNFSNTNEVADLASSPNHEPKAWQTQSMINIDIIHEAGRAL